MRTLKLITEDTRQAIVAHLAQLDQEVATLRDKDARLGFTPANLITSANIKRDIKKLESTRSDLKGRLETHPVVPRDSREAAEFGIYLRVQNEETGTIWEIAGSFVDDTEVEKIPCTSELGRQLVARARTNQESALAGRLAYKEIGADAWRIRFIEA